MSQEYTAVQVLAHRPDSFNCVAYSPDGTMLATASADRTIRLWEIASGKLLRSFDTHQYWINSVVFSPDGLTLASGADDRTIRLWEVASGKPLHFLNVHYGPVMSVAFSPDGLTLASGGSDGTIRLWRALSGRLRRSLEVHQSRVIRVAFAPDGRTLASISEDGEMILWNTKTREYLALPSQSAAWFGVYAGFLTAPEAANASGETVLGDDDIVIRKVHVDANTFRKAKPAVNYVSAKVVLMGESNVGKSCLVFRLTQDRYEEQGSTHGMRLWTMKPEQLDPAQPAPEGEIRDITIWDLGGQVEYRMIHQLFIHDTTLALILFHADRDETQRDEVREWNLRLMKQRNGEITRKMLIGTKSDIASRERVIANTPAIERLIVECNIDSKWHLVSAKSGKGINKLKKAIAAAIDWKALAPTNRLDVFQRVRELINQRQQRGETVLLYDDLMQEMRATEFPDDKFDSERSVKITVELLARQGVIVDTRMASGERALLLQIGFVEIYAASLILLARNNPRGVPYLEIGEIFRLQSFPGISEKERLPKRSEELAVLECVIQLLLERSLCIEQSNTLIFPPLFPKAAPEINIGTYSVSLYYDFTGAIDNIYASLVTWLTRSEQFGRIKLWKDRAIFEKIGQGICGLQLRDRKSGMGHLDLLFDEKTPRENAQFFTVFVESHLKNYGVEVRETLGICCGRCNFIFDEPTIKSRIENEHEDVGCPSCDTRILISEGAEKARESDSQIERRMIALKTAIDNRLSNEAAEIRTIMQEEIAVKTEEPVRILHLSDLHISASDSPESLRQPLIADLTDTVEGLSLKKIDYLVISGDLTNYGKAEEFETAHQFLESLFDELSLAPPRCIIVPGNHDLLWRNQDYEINYDAPKNKGDESYKQQGELWLKRNEKEYPRRFENFASFYKKLTQRDYPFDPKSQGLTYLFAETGIQFLTFNSAWKIDREFRSRSDIHSEAVSYALESMKKEIADEIGLKRMTSDAPILRIAVWHHPVTGTDEAVIKQQGFLERLRKADVKLILHGHVHEDSAEIIYSRHPVRSIHVAGAGSFGAGAKERPESTPRLYNLLEIERDHSRIRVHTRHQKKADGAWSGWAEWSDRDDPKKKLTYYDIKLK